MFINENTSLNATITASVDGVDRPIMSLNCSLNSSLVNFGINCSIIDKDQVSANAVEVQTQIDSFIGAVRAKMTELGYQITI